MDQSLTAQQEQLSLLPDSNTFPKNVGFAAPADLTLRMQRCLHVLQYAVFELFLLRSPRLNTNNLDTVTIEEVSRSDSFYDIPEEQIMLTLGYSDRSKFYSVSTVLEIFEKMAEKSIGFDSFGVIRSIDEKEHWNGFFKIFSGVQRVNGCFRFTMDTNFVYRVVNPSHSFHAAINWTGFESKYAPSIYEMCMFYYQQKLFETHPIPLDNFQKITGTHYKAYGKLKLKVIVPAIDNINKEDSFILHVTLNEIFDTSSRRGRKPVTHIQFKFHKKTNASNQQLEEKNQLTLTSQKTELRSLGIVANQINSVLDEARDESGRLLLRYITWSIRRGFQIKEFEGMDFKSNNEFGGYFRKNVIRECKARWIEIENLLRNFIIEHELTDIKDELSMQSCISQLREKVKLPISIKYLSSLSEHAFAHTISEFEEFLQTNYSSAYSDYLAGLYGGSITELAHSQNYYFLTYLDFEIDLFTTAHYADNLLDAL